MRVFLTGGSGLLGSYAAKELRAAGHQVVALHRRASDVSALTGVGCELVEGDARDGAAALAELMVGCTHVVHGAALVYSGRDWGAIEAVNVGGTRAVLEAAAEVGVTHAVHLSSVAVYGTQKGPVDEDTPIDGPVPESDFYARSKRLAEVVAREIERERGLAITVLRPCAVYGERDRLLVPAVARMVRAPLVFLLGPGRNALPVVYAGNVAVAIRLALESGRGGATYDLGLDRPLTQRQLLEGIARGMGRSPALVPTPAPVIRWGARALAAVGMSTPGAPHLPLNRVVGLALGENPYRSRRARAELGWDPPYAHEEALEGAGRWWVGAGGAAA